MILVLGGTSDSLEICDKLKFIDKEFILSVTTDYGRDLAISHAKNIILGKLNSKSMEDFIKTHEVNQIIDATHPYAVEVSKNALECAESLGVKYLRYERKSLIEQIKYKNIHVVDTLEEACDIVNELGNNIFIGTGSKNLEVYVNRLKDKNLIARVLPTSELIISCEKLGLNADNIIAMKGPFSKNINEETYKHYNIDVLITKESGIAGGFLEKIDACETLSIPAVIIRRSTIFYPNVINNVNELEIALNC